MWVIDCLLRRATKKTLNIQTLCEIRGEGVIQIWCVNLQKGFWGANKSEKMDVFWSVRFLTQKSIQN